jgi:hypothetical protein
VQADAGKTGGAIKRLLIEHGRIRQKPRALGKRQIRRTGLHEIQNEMAVES